MRAEYFGSCRPICPIEVIESNKLSPELFSRIQEFRFPSKEFSSEADRQREIKIDQMYHERSTYVVYCSPLDHFTIHGVARIIAKRGVEEKLPIEFGTVTAIAWNFAERPVDLRLGTLFSISNNPNILPACEIGGLRIADNHETNMSFRMRYQTLDVILNTCFKQIHIRGFNSFFLSCGCTEHMRRLYGNRFGFNEIATISYGNGSCWKALWRYSDNLHSEPKYLKAA